MRVSSTCSLCSYPISFSTEDHGDAATRRVDPATGNRDYFATCEDCDRGYRFEVNPDHGGSVDVDYYQSFDKQYITLYRYRYDTEQIARQALTEYLARASSVVEKTLKLADAKGNPVERTVILHQPNEDRKQSASLVYYRGQELLIAYGPDLEFVCDYDMDPRADNFVNIKCDLIGIISDTHGLMRPEAVSALTGCNIILHAGDIGKPEVLESLKQIAPVYPIRGNNDTGTWAEKIPNHLMAKVGEIKFYIIHDVKELKLDLKKEGINVVVSGHSHQPSVQHREDVLFVNPGSAGPRRFKLPMTVATLKIKGLNIRPELIDLNV